jgi:hypothetical protein
MTGDVDKLRHELAEVIGCWDEWKAMKCKSLEARMDDAVEKARRHVQQPQQRQSGCNSSR